MLLLLSQISWSIRIDGGDNDACYSMAFLPSGNLAVAGNYGDAVYVASMSPYDGSFVWQYIFAFPGDGRSNVKTLQIDPTDSSLIIGGTAYPYSGDDQACGFVAKLDSGSTVWMYVDSADGCGRREGFSGVVVGKDGHYYAYGTDYETYSSDLFTPSRRFVLKLDRGTGAKVWRYQPGGYSYTAASPMPDSTVVAVGFGADGEVQSVSPSGGEVWSITPSGGKFWAVLPAPNGHPTVAGIKDGDFYVAQLQRETGGVRWRYTANGADNDDDVALDMATDGKYIYVAGYLDNGINGYDAYVVKLDTLGTLLWSYTYNGPFNSDDVFRRILVAPDGGVVLGGYSVGSGTLRDVLILKLSPEGDSLWAFRYDSPYSLEDDLKAMVWGNGSVFACANSYSTPTDRDVVVLKVGDPTDVKERRSGGNTVIVMNGGVLLKGRGLAEVYDASGRKVRAVEVEGRRWVALRRGIWFVRFGGKTRRAIVR